jgi:hypothetical protein
MLLNPIAHTPAVRAAVDQATDYLRKVFAERWPDKRIGSASKRQHMTCQAGPAETVPETGGWRVI